jgi:hypothetical protein
MSQVFKNLVAEVERLIALPVEIREKEGVYADVSQLQFLLKKLNASNGKSSALAGIEKFVSDLASSDSEILKRLDLYKDSQNG